MSIPNHLNWADIASARKQRQIDLIPKEWSIDPPPANVLDVRSIPGSCGLLDELDIAITNTLDINIILAKLASSEWSSVKVTTAFYKRAIIAQQLTNCLTEIFINEALARAAAVDRHLKETGQTIGPLHGLPVSLKDQFCMKGRETIMGTFTLSSSFAPTMHITSVVGYVSWIGKLAEEDAVIVELLYACGAVPFVRTNVPQTLMWGETFNYVFGRTTNPHNRRLTPGGSSGGEGALIALHGSPIGIGTDIGGSVRIPAGFSGIYSLRPSYARLPYQGAVNSLEGQQAINSVIGPMCSHVSSLKAFTKAILDAKPWNKDPFVARKPWSEAEYLLEDHGGPGQKLCFAVMYDNQLVRPHPPIRRALRMVEDALKAAGHIVIEWENHPLDMIDVFTVTEEIYMADGGEDFRTACAPTGEPLLQTMSPNGGHDVDHHPWDPHPTYMDEPLGLTASIRSKGKGRSTAYELWGTHRRKREIQKRYLDHLEGTKAKTGTGRPVDAIICPVAPFAATPHGLNSNDFYTSLFNFLDYAAASIPVTKVDQEVDLPEPEPLEFYNHEDEAVYKLYKPETFLNAPVGVQVVGRTLEEEAVIAMTEIVVKALDEWKAKEEIKI
ncbi:hypothetical protein FRB95_012773 [Tulasnella sp. JGI-2019a]|nr:hypothetical protein FRB93_004726 [Tulasnella sp. JGI-2019a]KAG9039062.1 hypothetical protein FRB95_012773 [Tulasnella sp. JGI-2019a]